MMAPQLTERDNFLWLLIALVFLLASDAVFSQFESAQGKLLVNISLVLTLFVAVWALERNRRGRAWRNWKLGITFIIACLMVGDSLVESPILALGQLVGSFVFLSLSLYLVWKQVLFTGYVDTNKIVGAICIYILLGLIWAFGYLIAEEVFPGSFSGLDHEVWQGNLEQLIYYSMVTLTTVGYGDITPEQPVARFLAYMEGITSIFYTAILVASLIGVRMAGNPGPGIAGQEPGS
jgi:voltage-gated potassium channel Kch